MSQLQADPLRTFGDDAKSDPVDSLAAASAETLQALMMSHMNTAANLKKDIAMLISELAEQIAEARLAELLLARKQQRRRDGSLTEGVDTSTPAGKMIFTVLGAVAELERSLICERVKAGLRNARAKGKRLGRPKTVLDVAKIARMRKQGRAWRKIARAMGCSARTARRALQNAGQKGGKGILPRLCAKLRTRAPQSLAVRSNQK